jgi:hypothetical protein
MVPETVQWPLGRHEAAGLASSRLEWHGECRIDTGGILLATTAADIAVFQRDRPLLPH